MEAASIHIVYRWVEQLHPSLKVCGGRRAISFVNLRLIEEIHRTLIIVNIIQQILRLLHPPLVVQRRGQLLLVYLHRSLHPPLLAVLATVALILVRAKPTHTGQRRSTLPVERLAQHHVVFAADGIRRIVVVEIRHRVHLRHLAPVVAGLMLQIV